MNQGARGARYRLDFLTNPAYRELVAAIRTLRDKELASLQAAGRGDAEHRFNHQAGIVDGIERVQMMLQQLEEHARKDMGNDAAGSV